MLNLGYPLVSFTYVARVLNPEGIGLFNYALSIVGYFLVLSNLGIPRIAPVEIAKVKNNKADLSEKINGYFSLNVLTTFIVFVTYLILFLFFTQFFSKLQLLLFIFSIQILSNCIGLDWLMQGMLHFKQLVIRDLVVKVISLCLLFLLVTKKEDILIYGFLYVFSSLSSSIINYLYLNKTYEVDFGFIYIKNNIDIKYLITNIFPISILTTIYLFFDTTLAGFFLTMNDVGLYSFSIKMIRLILLIFDSIFVVLTPVLAFKLANEYDIFELNSTFEIIISNLFGLFMPLFFLIFLFSDSIVYFIGGTNFMESSLYLKCLMPMSFLYIYSSLIGSQILYNIGSFKIVRNILFLVLFVSLVIGKFIINKYKIIGVVFVVNFAFFLLSISYFYFTKKSIKGILIFPIRSLYKYFLSALISYIFIWMFFRSVSFQNIGLNLLLAIFYIFCYSILLVFLNEKYLTSNISQVLNKLKNGKSSSNI